MLTPLLIALLFAPTQELLRSEFGKREGALVLVDGQSNEWIWSDEVACKTPLAPCSTFKIWNTAFGFEIGLLTDPDEPFYKWDGKKRFINEWNQDLTLRKAFAVSCVPAYQELAREIGAERMNDLIGKIGYGDKNTSAGIDLFWLPEGGRKTILISPFEQADLIRRLVRGELPFSEKTTWSLEEIMRAPRLSEVLFTAKPARRWVRMESLPWGGTWVTWRAGRRSMLLLACCMDTILWGKMREQWWKRFCGPGACCDNSGHIPWGRSQGNSPICRKNGS